MSIRFTPLGGTTNVTENMYIYESGNDLIAVDCGIGFPDSDMHGVDVVIPDFSYVKKNIKRLKGILITHGHEDHIGAIPHLLKDLHTPIFATKLTAGFIIDKLEGSKMGDLKNLVQVFDPDKDTISLGNFKVIPFRISHSVPDAVGFAIDTPEGKIFHVADYKFDWSPVDGKPFDIRKLSTLASEGVLALASDCLGATSPGYTESEQDIEKRLKNIVKDVQGNVYVTTISSNIGRMQQAINAAQENNRKVVFVGRSIERKVKVAKSLGYIHFQNNQTVRPDKVSSKANNYLFILTGAYGQTGSALHKVANNKHDSIRLTEKDMVIFSGDPSPPGAKGSVDDMVDNILELGANVHYYDTQEDLHVSGHGSIEDIKMLMSVVQPKFHIPIGGTIRHMKAYSGLAQKLGHKKSSVFELKAGDSLILGKNSAKMGKKLRLRDVLVDGTVTGDIGEQILSERKSLGNNGVVVAILTIDKDLKILSANMISKGFIFEKTNQKLLKNINVELTTKLNNKKINNNTNLRFEAKKELGKIINKHTGRQPLIITYIK